MEALLLLADAIDDLAQKSSETEQPVDPWAGWTTPTVAAALDGEDPHDEVPADGDWLTASERERIQTELAARENALKGNEDPMESKVLRAEIYLLRDRLVQPPDHPDLEQRRAMQEVNKGGNVMIELPVPTEEEREAREHFLDEGLFTAMTDHYGEENASLFSDSYVKAGPLLLYYTDRDFVNGLPVGLKRIMIEDVEQYSPAEAHEMGRDILKDKDPGTERLDILREANVNQTDGNL